MENILEKVHVEKCIDRDTVLIQKGEEDEDKSGQKWEEQKTQYEKSVEERRRRKKTMILG